MIIVKNRELLIPNHERYIGTTYDTESENRQFLISRFAQNGVDLSALTFHLDLKYANDAPDTVLLDKEVTDTNIILTWYIGSSVLQVPGTLFIQIRAADDEVTVKWSSFHAALYVERHLNTPGNYTGSLTEIEQMEQDHQYMKGVVDELKSHLDYTHEAEAWAIGKKDGEDVPSTDETYHNNSKYYSEQANASKTAAANSATAAANSATQAAETVTDTNHRFNNAMSAVTSETEVIDARVGADGTVYTVLKNRLDAEHTDVKSAIGELEDMSPTTINCGTWELGSFNTTTGAEIASTTRLRSDYIPVLNLLPKPIIFEVDTGYKYCVYLFDANKSLISAQADLRAWKTTRNTIVFPSNTAYMRVLVANTSDSAVSTDYYNYVHIAYQSDMVEAVDDMQLRLDSLGSIENVSLSDVTKWHIGSIEVATGKDHYAGTNRLCSDYIRVKGYSSITISVDSGYKWALYAYSDSYGFVSAKSIASFKTTKETVYISGFDYVRLLVANTSDGAASSAFSSHIHCTGIMSVAEKLVHSDFTSSDSVFGWEIGTLNTANGEEIDGTTRLRSGYIAVGTGTVIRLSDYSTYNHLIYLYDTSGAFVRSITWQTTDIVITTDGYIRILIRYANNATITETDAETVASACSINYCLPYNLIAKGIDVMTDIKAQANIMKQKKTSAEAWGECDLKLLYFTDVHGDVVRTENLASIAKAWGSNYFNTALCGGDIVKTLGTESPTWYYNALSGIGVPLLNTVGNHDAWSALNGTLLPKTDVYNSIIAPTVSDAGIVQPTDAATNGYNYYYKDFNSKVRLIVLDCMYWDATQLAWLESVLADAKTNGLHVLCASHAAFPLANMTKVDCLWSKSGVNTDGVRTNIQAASAVKAFMDDGGIFVAWVVGHQHGDYVHVLADYGNQFVINLGSFAQRASFLLKTADPTAYNYNCMTYICVDATNKILKLLRIGADIDIYGTKHDGLVIDYNTNTLISSWS